MTWYPLDEEPDKPGPKLRPCLIFRVAEPVPGCYLVEASYGTSQVKTRRSWEFLLGPRDGYVFRMSGLSYATKFDVKDLEVLWYNDLWFGKAPETPRIGTICVAGVPHSSIADRFKEAKRAAGR